MLEKPRAIDLFCGAGGITQGLMDAGFEILWAVDSDKNTKKTFDYNHRVQMTLADIREIDPPSLGLKKMELELLVGGPPCSPFSIVGRAKINSIEGRDVKEDERFFLYENFLRYLDHFQPKTFVMENVKGMKSAVNKDGISVVSIIKEQMEDLGYNVQVQLLDAANYGVPQRRERVFFFGNRLGLENPDMEKWETHRKPRNETEKMMKIKSNEQTLQHYTGEAPEFPHYKKNILKKPWNTIADAILDLPPVSPKGTIPPKKAEKYYLKPISEYQHWVRDTPIDVDWEEQVLYNHECRGHNMRDLTIYKLLGEGVSWIIGNLPEDVQPYRTDIFPDKYKKQDPLGPSSTIVAHIYKDGNIFIHPREARKFTAREAARLQSFKDTFVFPVSRTQAYKQIGNAVPPLIAQVIGTAIKNELLDAI